MPSAKRSIIITSAALLDPHPQLPVNLISKPTARSLPLPLRSPCAPIPHPIRSDPIATRNPQHHVVNGPALPALQPIRASARQPGETRAPAAPSPRGLARTAGADAPSKPCVRRDRASRPNPHHVPGRHDQDAHPSRPHARVPPRLRACAGRSLPRRGILAARPDPVRDANLWPVRVAAHPARGPLPAPPGVGPHRRRRRRRRRPRLALAHPVRGREVQDPGGPVPLPRLRRARHRRTRRTLLLPGLPRGYCEGYSLPRHPALAV